MEEPDDRPPPALGEAERARLSAYVERFNARDFDTLRDMLAEDVQVELVTKTRLKGRAEVGGRYFGNYSRADDWHLAPGFIDRRPAIIARDPHDPARRPAYFILLRWTDGQVATIRDFRHAPLRDRGRGGARPVVGWRREGGQNRGTPSPHWTGLRWPFCPRGTRLHPPRPALGIAPRDA